MSQKLKPKELWERLRRQEGTGGLQELMENLKNEAVDRYISEPASEFNRGRVSALTDVVKFLQNGETP